MEMQISTGLRKAEFWLIASSRTGADGNPHETALVQEKGSYVAGRRLTRRSGNSCGDHGNIVAGPQRAAALHAKTERIWPSTVHSRWHGHCFAYA